MTGHQDAALAALSPEDRKRLALYLTHRLANAIAPLALRLEAESPETIAANDTLSAAAESVERIRNLIRELHATANPVTITSG